MNLRDDYVAAVEAENEVLRDRVAVLEEMIGMRIDVPLGLGLTMIEGRVFGLLLKRDLVTKEMAMMALYGDRPDSDEAQIKIVDVIICHLRRKLKAFGIPIETAWGRGYHMTVAAKATASALLPKKEAA